jgi:PAS domain-containing protein
VKSSARPFAVPTKLKGALALVLAYWEKLKRREAQMPFWDDVKLSALPELSARLVMIEASDKPVRFRFSFGLVGAEVRALYGGDLAGKFLDEIEMREPLQFIISQCSVAVESAQPTYYWQAAAGRRGSPPQREYSRLILPLWGDGRVGMLLGAFAWA